MDTSPRALVERQVRRIRRRLAFQELAQILLVSWAVALIVAALWFLGQSLFYPACPEWLRWTAPGVLIGITTLAALIAAWVSAPSLVSASLAIDERCELKERVTTFLTLPGDMLEKPAGQALAQDVQNQIAGLDAARRFPLSVRWRTALLPVVAGSFAVLAAYFAPSLGPFRMPRMAKAKPVVDAQEIQQQLDNLRKVTFTPKDAELKSEKLKELEAEWDKLVNRPLDARNEDQIRERVSEMKALEDNLRRRAEELKNQNAKGKELKELFEKLAQLDDKKLMPGPAKDLADALAENRLDKAREILDQVAKDLKAGKMDPDELKKMAEQFAQLQQRMKRVLERDDLKKQLEEKFKKGEINKEQLDRELKNLKDQMQDLKEWQDLADLIGECKDCMQKGDRDKAADEIAKALDKLKIIELNEDELKEVLDRLQDLENAENEILGRLEGDDDGDDDRGVREGEKGGGPPGRRRRANPDDPKGKPSDQRQKGTVDPKGQQRITGFAKGGNFTKVEPKDIAGAFKQAAQEAPEALDRQRIPQDVKDLAQGYFERLRGGKD